MGINVAHSSMFLSVLLLVLFLLVTLNDNLVSAQSPSFVRQEITDGKGDFNYAKLTYPFRYFETNNDKLFLAEPAANASECELGDFTLPDIKSVSFVSDGVMLNSTFWLNQIFLEPPYTKYEGSPFVNDSMIHQEILSVYADHAYNHTAEQVTEEIVKAINQNYKVTDIDFGITHVAGIKAINITLIAINNYTGTHPFGNSPVKLRDIIFVYNNTAYGLEYEAELEQFDKGLPNYQKMVSSFHIDNVTGNNSKHNNSSLIDENDYSTYTNPSYGITLQYPSDWQGIETYFSNDNVVSFFSPIRGPYLLQAEYGVKVFLPSVYHTKEVFEGYVQDIIWNNTHQTWNEFLSDTSSSLPPAVQQRIIYEKPIEGFFRESQPWVNIPLALRNINSPSQYRASFFDNFQFVKDGHFCSLGDQTNIISAPPPKFSFTYNPPSPISIGPNEEKVVEIKIQSSTDSRSHAFLSVENEGTDIQDAYFTSNQIEIPPSGWAIAQLVIKGDSSNLFQPTHPKTLRISATMISGDLFVTSGGNISAGNNGTPNPIQETSSLTVNVLSLTDYVLSGFSALNSSGAVTIITSIGTAIAGLLVGVFGKERILGRFKRTKEKASSSKVSKGENK
jgi:hypothetical protein